MHKRANIKKWMNENRKIYAQDIIKKGKGFAIWYYGFRNHEHPRARAMIKQEFKYLRKLDKQLYTEVVNAQKSKT